MSIDLTKYRNVLFEHLLGENPENKFKELIGQLSEGGYAKKEIYELFLEFHKEIQTDQRTKDDEEVYDRLSDFMDGFTSWSQSGAKILPNEPDA